MNRNRILDCHHSLTWIKSEDLLNELSLDEDFEWRNQIKSKLSKIFQFSDYRDTDERIRNIAFQIESSTTNGSFSIGTFKKDRKRSVCFSYV